MSYLRNILTTGAVSKTPKRVLQRIVNQVSLPAIKLVVELGAGKGEITGPLMAKLAIHHPEYIAFEIHKQFAEQLRTQFQNIKVLEIDALQFDEFIPHTADVIICSIPLSFFSIKDRKSLFEKIKSCLAPGGKAILLFHAFWLIPEFKRSLPKAKIISVANLPPYFILTYSPKIKQ